MSARELANHFTVSEAEREGWQELLGELEELGVAVHVEGRGWCSPRREGWVVGRLRLHKKGFGIARPLRTDDGGEIVIAQGKLKDARNGDVVLVRCRKPKRDIGKPRGKRRGRSERRRKPSAAAKDGREERREGQVLRVVKRSTRVFVGIYSRSPGGGVVTPLGREDERDVFIPKGREGKVRKGDRVLARCVNEPSEGGLPVGEVLERAAEEGTWKADLQWVLASYDFSEEFPDEVMKEVARFGSEVSDDAWQGRRDVRDWPVITIDPRDAKDFDDAMLLEARDDGGWSLKVFIADVSYFVTPGSVIDREAFRRGTSVYLPGKVVPMLPERLSNELCSLNEGEETLAKGVFMELDADGRLESTTVERVVMRSARRYTYEEAQEILEGGEPDEGEESLADMLRQMDLVRALRHRLRGERGALDLDLPEQRLLLDDDGEVTDIAVYERFNAHRLVEEFMLLANEGVARVATERNIQVLRRAHPEPPEDDVATFLKFCRVMLPEVQIKSTSDFPKLVKAMAQRREAPIVSMALLRTLTRAHYTPEKGLHFALALDEYCHFTSPIRRYPDLQVHQALDRVLFGEPERGTRGQPSLEEMGEVCSVNERHAEDAEREMKKLRTISWLHPLEGEKFPGIITAVFDFGFFVRLDDTLVEGMVHLSTLRDDFYVLNSEIFALKGRNSGHLFRLGDPIEVRLQRADSVERLIDFRYMRHLPQAD